MTEQTNDPREPRTPSFVGGAFGVTSRELEGTGADDPVAAFQAVEDHEDTGPDVLGASAEVPETIQQDVSEARTGADPGQQEPADVEGTTTEPSPGERNDPV